MKRTFKKFLSFFLTLTFLFSAVPVSVGAAPLTSQPEDNTGYMSVEDFSQDGAAGVTYYISNSEGSNLNNGTSSITPWKDFTNVNAKTFEAGDRILLKRGDIWNQVFEPKGGNGTSDSWIVVDAYGSGDMPVIEGASIYSNTMIINNASFWKVRNIEFRNAKAGPQFLYTTLQNQGIVLEDNYIHNLYGGPDAIAIHIRCDTDTAVVQEGDTQWLLKDVLIQNNRVEDTSSYGIVVMHGNSKSAPNSFKNIIVKGNRLEKISAKAIVFQCVQDSYWIDNYIDEAANVGQQGGTTASFLFYTKNIGIYNNIFSNTPDTSSSDQTAIDSEGKNENTSYSGNYFENNFGGAVEFLMINGNIPERYGVDYNRNHDITGNTFVANGEGALWATTDTGATSGTIKDNLFFENNLLREDNKFSQWSISGNNASVAAPDKIYNAGAGFTSDAQNIWSYSEQNGGSYSDLTYDASLKLWGNADDNISQFGMTSNSKALARTWTAPYDGTVSIRGLAFSYGLAAADIKVSLNDVTVDGSEKSITEMNKEPMNFDNIIVHAGDVLRFEAAAGAKVGWLPTVAYTSGGNDEGSTDLIPGAITDLGVDSKTYNSMTLQWTASGSNAAFGKAEKYEIRYSKEPITSDNFSQAERVRLVPFPAASGEKQSVTIPMLDSDTTYYIAMIAYNDVPNASLLSNVVSARTEMNVTEIQNPGFENDMEHWGTQGCSAEIKYGDSHTGGKAAYVSDRADSWGSVKQDITGMLNADGPGMYQFGAWARFAGASGYAFVTIAYTDEQGSYWVTSHTNDGGIQGALVSSNTYTEVSGTQNITWTGTLQSATIYFQSPGNLQDVYLDDFFVCPAEGQLDKSGLRTAIEQAKLISEDEYTEESYKNLESVMAESENLLTMENLTQEDLNLQKNLLNNAIWALEKTSYHFDMVLQNPGFEEGMSPWTNNGGSGAVLELTSEKAHTGNSSLYITNRSDSWHGATQDVSAILNNSGPGVYQFGVWAQYETQSSRAVVTLAYNDGASKYITSHDYEDGGTGVVVNNTAFSEVGGVKGLFWEGSISSANIYFQAMQGGGNTDNLYLDDFYIFKIRKTELLSLYTQNKDKQQGSATDEQFESLQAALKAAKAVIADSKATQQQINISATELRTVMDEMGGLLAADKTVLDASISEAQTLNPDIYTIESFAVLKVNLENALAVQGDSKASQPAADIAQYNLESSINTLRYLRQPADKAELQSLYDIQKDVPQGAYSDTSYATLTLALQYANEILEGENAVQQAVNSAKTALENAVAGLRPYVVMQNPGFEDEENGWIMPDWRAIATEPENVHSGNNSLFVVGRWAEYIGPEQNITEVLNSQGPGCYEFGVWTKFADAEDSAQAVISINGSTLILSQSAAANTTFFTQVAGLSRITWSGDLTSATISFRSGTTNNNVYLDDFYIRKVDTTKLETLISLTGYVTAFEYTPESYATFNASLQNADTILAKTEFSQSEVDDAFAALQEAYDNLVFQTQTEPEAIVSVSDFNTDNKTFSTVDLSWTPVVDAGYVLIQQALHGENVWTTSKTGAIGLNAGAATVTGLLPSTGYDFRLLVLGGQNGGISNVVTITTDESPMIPVTGITGVPTVVMAGINLTQEMLKVL